MKKILSKTIFSLFIITICVMLFCGVFAIGNLTQKKQTAIAFESDSFATLRGNSNGIWWSSVKYNIENLIITNNFDVETATGDPVDVSEEKNASLNAYKVANGDGTYNCVIYADVEKIYAPENSEYLFAGYKSGEKILRNVKSIIFENDCFDTSRVTNMNSLFYGCQMLSDIDVSKFDTSEVANMSDMFGSCEALTDNLDVSGFNTSNVTDMSYMFEWCLNLTELNLSSFDTSKVENMEYMFQACASLTELDLGNFDTSKVTTFDCTFLGCRNLTELNIGPKVLSTGVTSWNTSKVEKFWGMFGDMRSIKELDLRHFETSSCTDFYVMFGGCSSLEVVDISNFNLNNCSYKEIPLFGVNNVCEGWYDMNDGETIEEVLDEYEVQNGLCSTTLDCAMLPCKNLKQIKLPDISNNILFFVPADNELYINGEEDNSPQTQTYNYNSSIKPEMICISSSTKGTTLEILNFSSNVPTTGFVDEQLLPMIAVAIVSVLAVVCLTGAIKKRKNRI